MLRKFLWKNRVYVALALAVIVFVTITLILKSGGGQSGGFVTEAVAPWQRLVSGAGRSAVNFSENLLFFFSLKSDNERLNKELALLNAQNTELLEAVNENERLRKLLNYVRNSGFKLKPASVIGYDPDSYFSSFTIDLGSDDGIVKEMSVVAPSGLVGKVLSVSNNYSKVLLLTDIRSSVSCIAQRTRCAGSVKGKGRDLCEMKFLSINDDIKPGDAIVTSGDGKIYPKGVKVGEVTAVSQTADGMSYDVDIRPSVNVLKLEEVLVVVKY